MSKMQRGTRRRKVATIVAMTAAATGFSGAAFAASAKPAEAVNTTLKACVNNRTGVMRQVDMDDDCLKGERAISWKRYGIPGAKGQDGDTGPAGATGSTGAIGRPEPQDPQDLPAELGRPVPRAPRAQPAQARPEPLERPEPRARRARPELRAQPA